MCHFPLRYSCSGKLGESLNVGQNTGSLFVGIIGSLTAPGPSQVDTSDDQALLLWLGMEEYSTPTGYYCDLDGELTHYCWTQVGLAMGTFEVDLVARVRSRGPRIAWAIRISERAHC